MTSTWRRAVAMAACAAAAVSCASSGTHRPPGSTAPAADGADVHAPDGGSRAPDANAASRQAAPDADAAHDAGSPDGVGDAASTPPDAADGASGPVGAGPWVGPPYCPAGMAYVPEGWFLMGADADDPDAKPAHAVWLAAFCIDRTEVTVAAYRTCVEDGACEDLTTLSLCHDPRVPADERPNACRSGRDEHPVNYVSWLRAAAYCAWRAARLPTEAEWEKAARGTDGRTYPWGEGIDCDLAQWGRGAVYSDCLQPGEVVETTVPVESFPGGASPYGALQMAGNVDEWVADWYAADYYRRSPERNPAGPETGQWRVFRGGGFDAPDFALATWWRQTGYGPDVATITHGFRCAADPLVE